jgi:MFS family permease
VPETASTAVVRAPVRTATLWPVAASFVGFGMFWGGWSVAVADVERELGLSHGQFGLLLSSALLLAGVANALGGAIAERYGSGRVLATATVTWAAMLVLTSVVHNPWGLGVCIVLTFSAGGAVDTVMNVAATAALAGKPGSLVRFHALFNGGGAIGALGTGLLIANDASWRWWWAFVAIVGFGVAAYCARSTLPAGEPGEHAPLGGALRLLRREHLVVVAIAFAIGAMVEGGIDLWGVLFLRTRFPAGLGVAVTSAVIAYVIATTARVVFGPSAGRQGAARGVAIGASAAAAGLLLLALAPGSWAKGAGLVIAAGGISMCWPLLLAHATAARERPGAVVGAVSAVGYTGFFLGPTIVGWISSATSLRGGLVVLAAAAVFVAVAPNLGRLRRGASLVPK